MMPTRAWCRLGSGLLWAIVLSGCGTLHPSSSPSCASMADKSGAATVDSSVVLSLQRQVREREKRIADLESQLEALKVIDQDLDERKKSRRPPASSTPIE